MKKRNHLKSIISLLLISLILIGCFPVTAGAKSRVTDLEIEPITIIEGTYGDYDHLGGYFKYSPEDLLNFTATFADGKTFSSKGYSFEYEDNWYWFETKTNQSIDNQWTAGNTYTMTVTLNGVSVEVPVTITDTPVDRIEVEPVSVIEHTNGIWDYDFNNESKKLERTFFLYDLREYIAGTIYFKDGTSTEFDNITDCAFEYKGDTYWVIITDEQSVDNPWTVGNEYSIILEAMGVKANMPVTIEKTPIKSVKFAPVTLIENTSGKWCTENGEKYFSYMPDYHLKATVTFENGEVLENVFCELIYNDVIYDFDVINNQSVDNQWKAGNTYTATVEVMGFTTEVPIYIDYSPVQSVELKPVSIYEYSEGYWNVSYDSKGKEVKYFNYTPTATMEYTVTFKNGETVSGTGSEVYYGDYCLHFNAYDTQSIDNQWTAGNKYEMEVELTGIKTTLEVEIKKVPIADIEIEPVLITENTSGYLTRDYIEETDEASDEYYYYCPDENLNYTITFDDGSTVTGSGYSFDYCGVTYYFDIITDQSYKNQWTAGNTYTYKVKLMNIETEGKCTILSNVETNATV